MSNNVIKEVKLKAVPTSEYHGFMFAVTKEEYIRLMGDEPIDGVDNSEIIKDLYAIDPSHLLKGVHGEVEITISIKK